MRRPRPVANRKMWAPALVIVLLTAAVLSGLTFTTSSVAAVSPAATTRVSIDAGGRQSTEHSFEPAMSADGRWVAFSTLAPLDPIDLIASSSGTGADVPEYAPDLDVYVRDTVDDTTTLISYGLRTDAGTRTKVPADGPSGQPSISADGRFVAFQTRADNIVSRGYSARIVVCDRGAPGTGAITTECTFTEVSDASEEPSNPHLSAGGELVSYDVAADEVPSVAVRALPEPDPWVGWVSLVTLRRADNGTLLPPAADERVRIGAPPTRMVGDTQYRLTSQGDSVLATGGTHLAFVARYLPVESRGEMFTLVHDYDVNAVDVTPFDVDAAGDPIGAPGRIFGQPALSGDGSRVAFVQRLDESRTTIRLLDRDGDADGTLWPLAGEQLLSGFASRTTAGADGLGAQPAFSADGRYLAFTTPSVGMHNGVDDADRPRSCLDTAKTPAAGTSWCDIVVRDIVLDRQRDQAGLPRLPAELASPSLQTGCDAHTAGATCEGTGDSGLPGGDPGRPVDGSAVLSADGSVIAFGSDAPDLIGDPADTNGKSDVFQRRFSPTLTGGPQDFGRVPLGSEAIRDVALAHAGAGPLRVSAVTVTGADAADFAVFPGESCTTVVLRATEQCTVSVRFRPGAFGPRTAVLRVEPARGGPVSVALTGIGVPAPASSFAATPARLDFGARGVLRVGPEQTVTVRNPGTAPLNVLTVQLGAPTASTFPADYQVTADACGARQVPPGGTCQIRVRHRPKAVGDRPGVLRIGYVGTATLTHSVPLTGAGTPPTLTASPALSPARRVVQVSGANFPPASAVTLTLFGMPGNTVARADANGAFRVPFVLLPNTWTGNHPLTGTVQPASAPTVAGPLTATMDFLVVPGSPVPPDFDSRR